ncbi:uncharacterized protein LOC134438921 [Engraulis encrasicolus]|uniref:uncharacterized protein LOC134438921 n=1 Tax=Engraulis encrasicolus TaxID=184585 RepID=UPI002FD609A7
MLERLREQREPVGAVLASLRTDTSPLHATEYEAIKECLDLLGPVKQATSELSAEIIVSGSKIIPLTKMLRHTITNKQHHLTTEIARTLATNLINQMTERLSHYEAAGQHSLATLLDPRFKTMGFVSHTHQQNAVKKTNKGVRPGHPPKNTTRGTPRSPITAINFSCPNQLIRTLGPAGLRGGGSPSYKERLGKRNGGMHALF